MQTTVGMWDLWVAYASGSKTDELKQKKTIKKLEVGGKQIGERFRPDTHRRTIVRTHIRTHSWTDNPKT